MRFTPPNITRLEDGEVFVFGSNLSGIHGKGAAALAAKKFGARRGVASGMTGQSYAIPTRGRWIKHKRMFEPMEIEDVGEYVWDFITFARNHPQYTFLVTRIGCGYAGFPVHLIARLFTLFGELPKNIILPMEFWRAL